MFIGRISAEAETYRDEWLVWARHNQVQKSVQNHRGEFSFVYKLNQSFRFRSKKHFLQTEKLPVHVIVNQCSIYHCGWIDWGI